MSRNIATCGDPRDPVAPVTTGRSGGATAQAAQRTLAKGAGDSRIVLCQKSLIRVRDALDLHDTWSAPAVPDRCASFSPDGQWIATGDLDGGITLWKVNGGGRVRRTSRGHASTVKNLSFHPDGTRLVSCSVDG